VIEEIALDVRTMKKQLVQLDDSLKWQLGFIRDAIELLGSFIVFCDAASHHFGTIEQPQWNNLRDRYAALLKRSVGRV
jgi:hypothetical protein